MPEVHEDEEVDVDMLVSDEDEESLSPEERPIVDEEAVKPEGDEEAVEEELGEVIDEDADEGAEPHKVYPVDPNSLSAPLRPEELWDEDGTI